jgi:hypothetical protein
VPYPRQRRYTLLYLKSSDPTRREWGTRAQRNAREELLAWAKARDLRERAIEYLNRARHEPDGDVQSRFVDIAQHYRILAEAEASNAGRMGDERRKRALQQKEKSRREV